MDTAQKKAQTGVNIPPIQPAAQQPLLNQTFMQQRFGNYNADPLPPRIPNIVSTPPSSTLSPYAGLKNNSLQELLINAATPSEEGQRTITADEFEGAGRYDYFQPSSMGINNEDVAAQYQGWGEKMVNGVLKGGNLALTTFLQGTVGAVNGLYQWASTGKFSSFYDNEFNRALDETNKYLEDTLPNYYSNEELNASWYSPDYWMTGNFLWDGVVKNLGFAAGAYASGAAYASALRAVPLTARLFSSGKAAETLKATERGLNATNRGAGVYGEVKKLSDGFLNQYNLLNPSGRAVVAGLATQGEAGIEALHNMNEFRDGLIADYKQKYGLAPTGEELERINLAAEGAGNSSFAMNTAVLSASNYIMFPMIGRSGFGRDKATLNNLTRETNKMTYKGGKLVPKTSKLHPLLRTINKIRPYTFSVTEASEEVFQYGAAVASKDYYDKQYNNEPTSWMESLEVGLTDGVFSDEGAKNALIGGISGRLMTVRGMLRRNQQKASNTQRAVEEINNFQLSNFTKESMYAVNRAGVLIEEMQQAAQNGDEFTYKQLEKDFIINYLTPRIKYGRYDLVKQDIADAKKLASTAEGFAQLEAEGKVQKGDSREAYIARMDRLETIADNTNSLWQSLQLRYGGISRENPVTGELESIYTPSVMNKLIYTGVSTASLDTQITNLIQELSQGLPDVNFDQIITDILNNESKSYNEANDIITNLDAITEVRDELGKGLQDLAALAKLREKYIQEYQNIQENPDQFREEITTKAAQDVEDGVNTFVVKTKNGSRELVIGGEYFVGQGVDWAESDLTEPVVVAGFKVLNQNEDGTIRVEQDNGKVTDISPDKLLDYKVGSKGNLFSNKTANYYYEHRNDIFTFNFGKNFGGKKTGRLAYIDDKLYFVYKDINGNVLKKQLANKFFIAQPGFDMARITKTGKVTDGKKRAEKDFLSPAELAKSEQTLAKNRENRQQILNDIGVEQKRRLEELNKQLKKDKEKLAKIKEDFKNIEVMKDGRKKRIKLNFSKAQKNFTQAINKLTQMEADTNDRIKELEAEQEETAFNIAYFEDFGKDLLDLPGNTGEFLQELKDQVNLLEQNGKQISSELKSNNDLIKQLRKVSKAAIKILKSFVNEVAFFDQNDNMRLKELIDSSLKEESDLLQTWPLIKEALADFNLTNDVQKETGINVNSFDELAGNTNLIDNSLNSLRQEYKAKKFIVDRFQKIMDEYQQEKKAQNKIAKDPKLTAQLNQTQYAGPQIVPGLPKEPEFKKATTIIPRATVAPDSRSEYYKNETEKEHQVRANTFGANLWKFPNRKNIRGVYVTFKTQDQRLNGVIERLLDNKQELIDKYKDTAIAMVIIDSAGNLVGVDGQPIPEGEVLLDKAIYQFMPEAGLKWSTGESMFRANSAPQTVEKITKQYAAWRKSQLEKVMVPAPFEIIASQGIPKPSEDINTTSVVDADLLSEEDLLKESVLNIPTNNRVLSKGTVQYNSPLGSVYIDSGSGLFPLSNRRFLNDEASAIYDAIYTLAKEVINKEGGATTDTAVRMLNFLKGITYWGIPRDIQTKQRKDIGRNSIFFERQAVETPASAGKGELLNFSKLVLRVGPNQVFDFNPSDLKKNKTLIIDALSQMFINVNKNYTENVTQTFEEIISVSEEGEVRSITWPNYQTYMLSSKNPDFLFTDDAPSSLPSKREDFQIPLTVNLSPIVEGSDEVNREGIYFVDESSAESYELTATQTKQKPSFISATPKGPTSATAPGSVTIKPTINALDGKTKNQFVIKPQIVFNFVATADVNQDNYAEKIKVDFRGEKQQGILAKFEEAGKDGKNIIKKAIFNFIQKDAAAKKAQESEMTYTISQEEYDKFAKKRTDQGKPPISNDLKSQLNSQIRKNDKPLLREVVEKQVQAMSKENWKEVRSWMDKNLPQVPLARVRNIIRSGGRTAWGMFQDNAMYVYENAEVGTAYHEAFEAVYAMYLDSNEIAQLNEEFKARRGSFVDRPTGRTVEYKNATADQIREQLAEEFRDYIQDKKKPKGNFFTRLFNGLKKFIEGFFVTNRTEELFKRIDSGDFAQSPTFRALAMRQIREVIPESSAVFRLAEPNIPGVILHDLIEDMTYNTLIDLLGQEKSIFDYEAVNKVELYDKLKTQAFYNLQEQIEAYNNIKTEENSEIVEEEVNKLLNLIAEIDANWPSIVKKHQEYLQAYSISFDTNDALQVDKEGVENDLSNKGYNFDARKIDGYRKTNPAVRLLLATVPKVEPIIVDGVETGDYGRMVSSVNGVQLIPPFQVYISLLNELHNATNITDMLKKFQSMAEADPNYRTLYKRVTGLDYNVGVSLNNITEQHQLRVVDAFWKTFKKQNPQTLLVNILPNGEVSVSDTDISGGARQLRQGMLNSIVSLSRAGKGIFRRNQDLTYSPDVAKLDKYPLNTPDNQIGFLRTIGISFNQKDFNSLSYKDKRKFSNAVQGIKKSIANTQNIAFFSTKSLSINKRLMQLAEIKYSLENPIVSSTYRNVQGERTQSYIGPNVPSEIYNTLQETGDNVEDLASSPYGYLVTDVFSQNSLILDRYRNGLGGNLFKPGYTGGIKNQQNGRSKKSSQLSYRERVIQELNMNVKGVYMNLVPADSGMEHDLQMENWVTSQDAVQGFPLFKSIMRGYFIDEVNLAREDRKVEAGYDSTDLRFFKEILGEEYDAIKTNVLNNDLTAEEVYEASAVKINDKVMEFLKDNATRSMNNLTNLNILTPADFTSIDPQYILEGVEGFSSPQTNQALVRQVTTREANFVINNIEMYKVMYGDPYAYGEITKRSKSFLSPRQVLISNDVMWNNKAEKLWNRDHAKGSIGYTDFTQDYFKTATHEDVEGVIDLPGYGVFETTDGQGIIIDKAYRNFRIRTADWNPQEEKQYAYDIAYEKRDKNQTLTQREKDLLKEGNPDVKSAYKPLKPIASGSKLTKEGLPNPINSPILDKYSLYPLSYRVIKELNPGANNIKLYNKMQQENVDYVVFKSGRKVGAEELHSTYNEDGSFNNTPYEGIINIPFNAISLQQEVPSKDSSQITRASQITKIATLDLMESGKPVDYAGSLQEWLKLSPTEKQNSSKLYREIENNKNLLDELSKLGLERVQKKLGITGNSLTGRFVVEDLTLATQTLREEILKRVRNDNIPAVLDGFLAGEEVIEGTPAYDEVRNILYSLVQKNIVRPRISGGQKVQISSALFESGVVKEAEINGKKGYTSDVLKFYEEGGETVMEVMVGRWFGSNLSDKELLDYLNNTEEGQKALRGIAFRIPTQAQNSVDSIKIKQFLPREFGDSVVVPAAIVEKVGSDFDIDKLYMYFKNMYYEDGKLQVVPFNGIGEGARKRFEILWDSGSILSVDQQKELQKRVELFEDGGVTTDKLIEEIFAEVFTEKDVQDDFLLELSEKGVKEAVIDRLYTQSIENEYIESLQTLIELPENRERLLAPNNSEQLEKLAEEMQNKRFGGSFDYKNINNILNSTFTSRLRYAFKAGKKGIGVAASNSVSISVQQKVPILLPLESIPFTQKNTVTIDGKQYVSYSGVKNAAGENISAINGQFVDGYVDIAGGPWVMELNAIPQLTPMFLYLVRAGVPINSVVYFMNQPIVIDYVNEILNRGYSYLNNAQVRSDILSREKYDIKLPPAEEGSAAVPNEKTLLSYVGSEINTDKAKEDQVKVLSAFVRIFEGSRNMFTITQGLNWDTSTFNDPFLIFRKEQQVQKANELSQPIDEADPDSWEVAAYDPTKKEITSVPEAIFNNTFLGETAANIIISREGIANFLKSDQKVGRNVLQTVLKPFALTTFDSTFVKIARRAVNSLFDFIVQTDQGLNELLPKFLIPGTEGVASQVDKFVQSVLGDPNHPLYNNTVIRMLETDPSKAVGRTPDNLKLSSNDNKMYQQNSVIFGFREIKNYLNVENNNSPYSNLYKKIVITSILQSGVSSSPISFTQLLPYEDFSEIYNPSLSKLENLSNLNSFTELGMFQRNNWGDNDIVPYIKAPTVSYTNRFGIQEYQNNPGMVWLPKQVKAAIASEKIPQLVSLPASFVTTQNDYVLYSWNNPSFSKKQRKEMASRGDFSFLNRGLFTKVYHRSPDGTKGDPYLTDVNARLYYYFKHINGLGDGYRAQEYYDTPRPSVFDNGLLPAREVQDEKIFEVIESKLSNQNQVQYNPKQPISVANFLVKKVGNVGFVLGRDPQMVYKSEEINAQMLTELGYTQENIGKILKEICK